MSSQCSFTDTQAKANAAHVYAGMHGMQVFGCTLLRQAPSKDAYDVHARLDASCFGRHLQLRNQPQPPLSCTHVTSCAQNPHACAHDADAIGIAKASSADPGGGGGGVHCVLITYQ